MFSFICSSRGRRNDARNTVLGALCHPKIGEHSRCLELADSPRAKLQPAKRCTAVEERIALVLERRTREASHYRFHRSGDDARIARFRPGSAAHRDIRTRWHALVRATDLRASNVYQIKSIPLDLKDLIAVVVAALLPFLPYCCTRCRSM